VDYKILQGLHVFAFMIFLCSVLSIMWEFGEDACILMLLNHLNGSLLVQGLETSTTKEGRKYFEDITNHKKNFVWVDDQDGSHIELTFSKKRIADRKQWFTNFQVSSHLLHPKL
jgi:hypothetical protein